MSVVSDDNLIKMKLLLSHLPDKLANNGYRWFEIGAALFNWSNGDLRALELWKYFSLKGKNTCKCEDKWNQFKLTAKENPKIQTKTVYTLIKLHQLFSQLKWTGCYDVLHGRNVFNLLENIKCNTIEFSSKFVSETDSIKLNNKEIILIKSHTGSGKSQFIIRKLLKQFPDAKLLSIVSRVSLAAVHEQIYQINHYQKVKEHGFGFGEVICIDSLMKLAKFADSPDGEYILILDEFNSLIMHTLNPLPNMSENRFDIYKIFKKLIQKAKFVVGMDADISTGTINFIKELTNLPTTLYINTFKQPRVAPVVFYSTRPEIRNEIIQKMLSGEKVFVISDDKSTFLKTFVVPIWNRYPELRDQMLVYTSEQGDPNDFGLVNELWLNKNVFGTPKILYGVDYDIANTHHVFNLSFGKKTLNALELNQQIARIRTPLSINIYTKNVSKQKFFTLKDVETNHQLVMDTFQSHFILDPNIDIQLIPIYKELVCWKIYLDDCLKNNITFHLTNLLTAKGYTNISTDSRKRRFKFPKVTDPEMNLYKKTLLTCADSQFASFAENIYKFVKKCYDTNNYDLRSLEPAMKADQTIHKTVVNYYNSLITHKACKDSSDGQIQSFANKLFLAKKMNDALKLNWLNYDRKADLNKIANQRPQMVPNSEFIGQILSAFPKFNQYNKFNDRFRFKNNVQYYDCLLHMTSNLFPALFKQKQVEYRNNESKRCTLQTFEFNDLYKIIPAFRVCSQPCSTVSIE